MVNLLVKKEIKINKISFIMKCTHQEQDWVIDRDSGVYKKQKLNTLVLKKRHEHVIFALSDWVHLTV